MTGRREKLFIFFQGRYVVRGTVILLLMNLVILLIAGKSHAIKYQIARPSLGAEFSFELEDNKRRSPDIDREDVTATYSERLDIETEGWIYHPALVIYTLTLSPEWEQLRKEDETGGIEKTHTFLEGYSGEFKFLQYKPYTITLYGSRSMSTVNSNFAERTKSRSDIYGATLELKNEALPSILDYNHFENRQSGFFKSKNVRDWTRFSSRYRKMGGDTRIDASYLDNEQTTGSSTVHSEISTARFQNTYGFGKKKDTLLNSSFNARAISTSFSEEETLTWAEDLRVKHRRNLSSQYSIKAEGTDRHKAGQSSTQTAGFGLSHILYENLITSINIDGSKSKFEEQGEDSYDAGIDWHYQRAIPGGKILVNIKHDYRVVDTRFVRDLIEIIDESVVLSDAEVSLLNHDFVDTDSIIITDLNHVPYIMDVDYRITSIGNFTRILRLNIADGTKVFVSYRYQSDPAYDFSLFDQAYGVTLNLWRMWRLSYRFNQSQEFFLRGIEPDELSKNLSHTARTELNWKWSYSELEYIIRKSTELPYERWRGTETIILRPSNNMFWSLSGSLGQTKFTDSGDIERFSSVSSRMQMILPGRRKFSMNGFIRDVSGTTVSTLDSGFNALFEWVYRIYNGNIMYQFTEQKDRNSEELLTNHVFLFVVRRELF